MSDNNISIQATVNESVLKNSLKKIQKLSEKYPIELETNLSFDINDLAAFAIGKIREALSDLKNIDTILTEISKTSDKLSASDLKSIGDNSFDIASKYGKKASDYLSGVLEASIAGYDNADEIAELSLAAQAASEMTAELAGQYIIATDRAFEMNGSIEALTKTLDGANNITNHNAVNMTELLQGITAVGAQADSSQQEIAETTAAVGALIAVTHQGGSEMGNAFKSILMNLRQVTGEAGDTEISAESIADYKEACEDLGVSMTEVINGAARLKEPMQILKELSEEYTKLDESDSRRTNLLNAAGSESGAEALNALLENYSLYEDMLRDYASGTGSLAAEAEKTANSWESSLSRLSNTWTDTVENVADSDAFITIINGLNGVLSAVNNLTSTLGSFGTIGLGAGLFAGLNNVGVA